MLQGLKTTLTLTALSASLYTPVDAQDWSRREFPLAPPNAGGNFVAPYFDGFYENADGSFTLSFGFMNRNDEMLIEIPHGPNNFVEPAQFDGSQPTSFPVVSYSGFGGPRERGTFGIVVPADFEGDVWWTITTGDYTTRVPGRLESPGPIIKGAYELSTGPMAAGSLRPGIQFVEDGPVGWGIGGIRHPEHFTTSVGEPIDVQFRTFDRGERDHVPVNMTLWKHQGPVGGTIAFASNVEALPGAEPPRRGRRPGPGPVMQNEIVPIPVEGANANLAHFSATFDTPGEYIIRIRIDNFRAPDSTPGQQCCWSNGYVTVSVNE